MLVVNFYRSEPLLSEGLELLEAPEVPLLVLTLPDNLLLVDKYVPIKERSKANHIFWSFEVKVCSRMPLVFLAILPGAKTEPIVAAGEPAVNLLHKRCL